MKFIDDIDHKEVSITLPSQFEGFLSGVDDILIANPYANRTLTEDKFISKSEFDKYTISCTKCFEEKHIKNNKKYMATLFNEPVIFIKNGNGKYTSRFSLLIPKITLRIKYGGSLEFVEGSNTNYFYSNDTKEFKTSVNVINQIVSNNVADWIEFTYKVTYCLDVIYSLYFTKVDFNVVFYVIQATKNGDVPDHYKKLIKSFTPKNNKVLTYILNIMGIKEELIWDGDPSTMDEGSLIYAWSLPEVDNAPNKYLYHDVHSNTKEGKIDFKSPCLSRIMKKKQVISKELKEFKEPDLKPHGALCDAIDSPMTYAINLPSEKDDSVAPHTFLSFKLTYTAEKDKSFRKTRVVKKVNTKITQPLISNLKGFLSEYGSPLKSLNSVECTLLLTPEVRHKKGVGVVVVFHVSIFNPLKKLTTTSSGNVEALGDYFDEYVSDDDTKDMPIEDNIEMVGAYAEDFE